MSLKDRLQGRLEKLADDVVPLAMQGLEDVRRRIDELNCSLASRSIPDDRRSRVSELSLRQKAEQAGQRLVEKGPKKGSGK
ncbi:hypothetical protein [Marinobacter pelagius]|uniref:Uncharacterized protein n=1 Tax=Marinobacter pelagius TaxID=379482 RepID=A0A1I4TWH3_9GAMM|nr:hypothetical protein [Marinobacter pelagius]SFM80965.1 hypothetical protein SAMN04487961_1326 [Marinobacter pelagius]